MAPQVGLNNLKTREKWLEAALKRIPAGLKILDAGAGELQYKKFCQHLNYVSQDFAQYDGQGVPEGLQTKTWDNSKLDIISDIIDMPVEAESFDAIMCIEVFEHLPQPVLAIKEFSRVLKPGGYLITTAPFASFTHFAPYFYANGYSKYWYQEIYSKYGFTIEEISINGNFFEYLAQELRRLPDMVDKYCHYSINSETEKQISLLLTDLEQYSSDGNQSAEFAAFGYHVFARKELK